MSLLEKATLITTPTAHSNGTLHSIKGGAVADFDVVRGSAATRVNAEGLIESVATNIPRIDYTTGEGVVLLEPQSTNLITYSENFSDANWNASSDVIIDKGYLAPDGTNNATKITVNGANPKAALLITTSTIVTKSIYARTVSGTGTVYLGEGNINGVLSNVTEQWQRFEISNDKNHFYAADFRGASTLTEVIIWGAQVEALPYATSYIPTSGAIATRLADSVTGAGDATTFNSTEGVLYAEMAALVDGGSNRYISLIGNAHRISIQFRGLTGRIQVNGTNFSSIEAQGIPQDNNNKIAVSYSSSGVKLFVNGVLEDSNTDNPNFPTNSLTSLDFDLNNTNPFYGKVKALAVFNEALTDSELECLTTI